MLRTVKAQATHVPYKGVMQALNDVIGGQVDFALDPGTAIQQAKAGKVRILGAVSSVRSQILPDLPTLAESGVDTDAGAITVLALYGPARMPRDIVTRLNSEVSRIMQSAEARTVVTGLGSEVLTTSPSEFTALLRRDRERYGVVIREANIRIE
jgi:tripartite-type tricarboxylate transporter receptor subunit TctC